MLRSAQSKGPPEAETRAASEAEGTNVLVQALGETQDDLRVRSLFMAIVPLRNIIHLGAWKLLSIQAACSMVA